MNQNTTPLENFIFSQLRTELERGLGFKIDFRSMQYIANEYGLTPCFDYSTAETAIPLIYKWCNGFIEAHKENYPTFSGWEYNLSISIDALKTSTLKEYMEYKAAELCAHFTPTIKIYIDISKDTLGENTPEQNDSYIQAVQKKVSESYPFAKVSATQNPGRTENEYFCNDQNPETIENIRNICRNIWEKELY